MRHRTQWRLAIFAAAFSCVFITDLAISADDKPKAADSPAVASPAPAKADNQRELHLVGIYQGYTKTGKEFHGNRASITVDRPGKEVILAVSSYEPTTWNITVKNGTLQKVILCGYHRQAVTGIAEDVAVEARYSEAETSKDKPAVRKPLIHFGYQKHSAQFRSAARLLHEVTKLSPTSFQGQYTASGKEPFAVDQVDDDPQLSPDYPQPTPLADLPKLEFSALQITAGQYRHDSHVTYGEFTLGGPKKATLKPLPPRIEHLAFDPKQKKYYGLSGHALSLVDFETAKAEKIPESMDVPRLSWPNGITFDTKRDRVLISTFGGEDHLYSYEPATEKWKVVCSLNNLGMGGLTYHAASDTLYGIVVPHSGEGASRPWLYQLNAAGAVIGKKLLEAPLVPGILSPHSEMNPPQMVALEKHLVLIIAPSARGSEGPVDPTSYTFLYRIEDEKLWLTSKTKTP